MKRWVAVVGGIFGVLFVLWLAGTILIAVDPEGVARRNAPAPVATAVLPSPTQPVAAPRAPTVVLTTPTPVLTIAQVGSTATIQVADLARVPVAVDQKAMDDLSKASAAKDVIGWNQVINEGRAFWVPVGSRVLVLELDWETTRVRLLDGPQAGRTGWLISTNVRP